MTRPTPLEAMSEGRVGFIEDTPTPWTVIRHGWPAILLFAVILTGALTQAQLATAADPEGRWAALSATALSEGRWWTVFSHIPIQQGFLPQAASLILLFFAAMDVGNARDRDWMGGWRLPVVFLTCSLAGAAVHILSGSRDELFGVWPGLLGLIAFYSVSGRGAGLRRAAWDDGRGKPKTESSRLVEALALAANTAWFIVLMAITGSMMDRILPTAFSWPAVLIAAAAASALVFLADLFGNKVVRRLTRGAVILLLTVCGMAYFIGLADLQTFPWAALIGGAVIGLLAGVVDRRGGAIGMI